MDNRRWNEIYDTMYSSGKTEDEQKQYFESLSENERKTFVNSRPITYRNGAVKHEGMFYIE